MKTKDIVPQETIDKIISLYTKEKMSMLEIKDIFNFSITKIERILNDNNIYARNITERSKIAGEKRKIKIIFSIDELVYNYVIKEWSIYYLKNYYKLNYKVIIRLLKEQNIILRTPKEQRETEFYKIQKKHIGRCTSNFLKGKIPHNKIKLPPKEELEEYYITKRLTPRKIGDLYGTSNVTVFSWLNQYNIPIRTNSESNKGRVPWHKGLTKETHPTLKKMSDNMKEKIRKGLYIYPKQNGISKVSQEFCWKILIDIYQTFNDTYKNIFFGELNFEYPVSTKTTSYRMDFYIKEINLAIEYDGKYWHRNKKEHDNFRKLEIEESLPGIKIISVNEDTVKNFNIIDVINNRVKELNDK